jgi:GntR family transcriptional repressor for pyruvate dehydrogenase complex
VLAGSLRQQILGNRMQAGARLPAEPELIEQSGFSRATVREALRLLEADGLIAIRRGPKGGITVRQPDLRQVTRSLAIVLTRSDAKLADLFALRRLLEPSAAALAARNATVEQRAGLSTAAAADPGLGHAVEFHHLLAAATGNPLLEVLISVLNDILDLHAAEENLSSADLAAAGRHHCAVATAIAEGEAEAASQAMDRHIGRFERALSRHGRLSEPIVPRRANGGS